MLLKENRLTQKKDFDSVFKKGKTVKGAFLTFRILKNRFKDNRIGFVISKKVSNRATKRNLVRRRLRQAVSSEIKKNNQISNKKSSDIVIIAMPTILNKSFPEIQKIISGFFKENIN